MKKQNQLTRRSLLSGAIILTALGLAYAPIPGLRPAIVVVSGTELQEPLQALEAKFKQTHPNIDLTLKFQGSQELVNKYLNDQNDFKPTVLIPANGELLSELETRWKAQNNSVPFQEAPRSVAKTMLVAIAWAERGKVLFPDGRFRWERLEQAMQGGSWEKIGGQKDWGSFDFVMTDPTRSNSGQLTLSLWLQSKLGSNALTATEVNSAQPLIGLIKRSVYQPPRSTDVLLQEFITRGVNDADVATTYESIALYRWQQSATTQGKPYQIYYPNPTAETISTAAIVQRDVDGGKANAAKQFLDFLTQPEQQAVFVQYGFRPVNASVDLQSVPNSPWQKNIPGSQVNPTAQLAPLADAPVIEEIQRLWERSN
jgi:ABC-type molybdate transport system substrate-binding protein